MEQFAFHGLENLEYFEMKNNPMLESIYPKAFYDAINEVGTPYPVRVKSFIFHQTVLFCAGREYIFTPVSTWPQTDWSLLSKQRNKCYKILYLCISTPVYLGSVSAAAIDIPVLPGFRRQTAGTDGLSGWVCTVMVKSNWSAIP